jgi:cytochrome c
MQRILKFAFICTLVCYTLTTHAADNASAPAALALVHKVIAYMKENGKEKTISEINDGRSKRFIDRDLYIVVNTLDGKNLAHGVNPRIVGLDLSQIKDVDGKYYVKESLALIKTNGQGWVDYKWPNPKTQRIEEKSSYFERFEDVIISCGIYR